MSFFPIETDRVILRAVVPEDAKAIAAYQGREDVAQYVSWQPRTRQRVEELISRWIAMNGEGEASEGVQYVVVDRASGEIVGDCMLMYGDREARQGEIGYLIDPRFHGRGFATEAARAMLGVGFEVAGMHRISARCDGRNTASWRVMEKLGMRREAHFRDHAIIKGEWGDEMVYAICEDEWRSSLENQ